MHKGREYPQVIPHELTPDGGPHFFAPASIECNVFYARHGHTPHSGPFVADISAINLAIGGIAWAGDFSQGGEDFTFGVRQILRPHKPGMTFQWVLADFIGGLCFTEFYYDNWQQPFWPGPLPGFGTLVSENFSPPFDFPIIFVSMIARQWH